MLFFEVQFSNQRSELERIKWHMKGLYNPNILNHTIPEYPRTWVNHLDKSD